MCQYTGVTHIGQRYADTLNTSAFGVDKQGLGLLKSLSLAAGWIPQERDSEMEIGQQSLTRKCFGCQYLWMSWEGSRAEKMESSQLTPTGVLELGGPFIFVQNWVDWIKPLFSWDTKYQMGNRPFGKIEQ